MNAWYANVFKGFMSVSVILLLISLFTSGKTAFGAELAGYSCIIIAILLILLILFQNKALGVSICFIIILAITGFILFSLISFRDNIIDDHVAPYFKTYTTISIILILLQTFIMYSSVFSDSFEKHKSISSVNMYLLYLLSVFSLACSLIIYVILNYYTTDG
uniref:Uncharacterized protein n=1 Tax=viral metagenome TaxID=1070528 RepID=A0A6C0LN03_9ZZZZ